MNLLLLCQNSFSSQGLEDNFIFNDKLILYYSHPKDDFNANQDSIVILDYNTCTTMAFCHGTDSRLWQCQTIYQ